MKAIKRVMRIIEVAVLALLFGPSLVWKEPRL